MSGEYVAVGRIGGDTEPSEYSRRVEVVVDTGPDFVPQFRDCFIEPSASRRASLAGKYLIIDPQHGGSVTPWAPHEAGEIDRRDGQGRPAAACVAAMWLGSHPSAGRIVVRADAGLDDLAAAAVQADLIRPLPYSAEVRARLEAISVADGMSWAGLPEWAPGQRLADVTATFPGLARICACSALPIRRRVELVADWLATGQISDITAPECVALGISGSPAAVAELDSVARAEMEAVAPRVTVWPPVEDAVVHPSAPGPLIALVDSPLTGLSGGRGAMAYGYQFAPVVVAFSPLTQAGTTSPVTIPAGARCASCGDTLAEPAERALGVADEGTFGGLGGCGDHHSWVTARRLVTIARAPNARAVTVDWARLLAALNEREPGWGGNLTSGIIGSPKPGGTALGPQDIARLVSEAAA
ncbi:MAG TPA: hypothetical protein VFP50_15540 [Anaeromyxobacteraceae bacterium]|nr:hypothetical protein [Anaeromyxobacteraceae bacterium]